MKRRVANILHEQLAPGRSPVRPWLAGEIAIMLILIRVYDYVRSLAATRRSAAEHNGQQILRLEQYLHLDLEQGTNHWLAAHHVVQALAAGWYQFAHLSFALGAFLWCYAFRPRCYRALRNALIMINMVGLVVFAVTPVMPPRLLPFMHYVDSVAAAGFGTSPEGPVPADQYGAMPSLHIAWALWVAAAFILSGRRQERWLWCLYPVVTAVVVVVTANHYVLDVVAGAVTGGTALWIAFRLLPRFRRRTGAIQMTRRRHNTNATQAPGTRGPQTVTIR